MQRQVRTLTAGKASKKRNQSEADVDSLGGLENQIQGTPLRTQRKIATQGRNDPSAAKSHSSQLNIFNSIKIGTGTGEKRMHSIKEGNEEEDDSHKGNQIRFKFDLKEADDKKVSGSDDAMGD